MAADDKAVQIERARVEAKLNQLQAMHTSTEAKMDELAGVEAKPRKKICKSCFVVEGNPHRPKCAYNGGEKK